MIYFLAVLALIYPAIANRNNDAKFKLIMLFAVQCVMQPFFAKGDPTANYLIIIGINFSYAVYALAESRNNWWKALSAVTFLASLIECREMFLYYSDMSEEAWIHTFKRFDAITILITAIQTFLIIRASDGYVGASRYFRQHLKTNTFQFDSYLRRIINPKSGKGS